MNEPNAPENQSTDDLRELYRAGQQPVPPAALGEEIRQAARDALHTQTQRQAWPWRQGVAVAAVLVLSVSILLLLPREQLRSPGEAVMQAPPQSDAPLQPAISTTPALEAPPAPAQEKKRKAVRPRQESPPAAARALQPAPTDEPGLGSSAAGAAANVRRDADPTSGTIAEEAEQPSAVEDDKENSDVLEKSYYRGSPELWISHIERLLSEGRFADAKREFDAFQARYPKHPYASR